MNYLQQISSILGELTGMNKENIYLILVSVIASFVIKILKEAFRRYYMCFVDNQKLRYTKNQKISIAFNMINIFILFVIWEDHLTNFLTIISFISAGATIALREVIFNLFAGIYINIKKPFSVEDRIEVNGIKGDVININSISFEILEIGGSNNGEQSTGVIINFPNSVALTTNIKNYVKEFKYIWNETTVKIDLDSDLKKSKAVLYKIINNVETIKKIPKKMENQIDNISLDYRIYFNKLDPIIYTKVVDNHIELYIRYLVHPKKKRMIEDEIWTKILQAYKNKEILLCKD